MIPISQILSFLQAAGGFLFIFGIVVLVHELGHFIAAKMTGVYAPRFSIGFGPGPRRRWGETQYQIGVIPLGGYVRMASREDEATAFLEGGSEVTAEREAGKAEQKPADWDPEAMIPFGPKPVPTNRWFESKSLVQRLFILVAGVTMNALLTVAILFALNATVGRTILQTREVAAVRETPATMGLRQQLLPGDTILRVQGVAVGNWNDILEHLVRVAGDSIVIETSRGRAVVAAGRPESRERLALITAIEPHSPPVLGEVEPGMPAARGGLQVGDSVIAIDGEPVRSFTDLTRRVNPAAGRDVIFTVVRGAETVAVTVRPEPTEVTDPATNETSQVGRIGVRAAPGTTSHERLGPGSAFVLSLQQTQQMATGIVRTLKGLVQREVSLRELGGPIMIAQESANAARRGVVSLLELLALLSINLAVLNLLPIPVLDGGQILIVIAESIKGTPFSPRARQFILGTGVALVLLLMLVVSYNDILRLFRS